MVLVLRPNFSVLVLSLDTCGLGLVSFGLGLEPCGLVNIIGKRAVKQVCVLNIVVFVGCVYSSPFSVSGF